MEVDNKETTTTSSSIRIVKLEDKSSLSLSGSTNNCTGSATSIRVMKADGSIANLPANLTLVANNETSSAGRSEVRNVRMSSPLKMPQQHMANLANVVNANTGKVQIVRLVAPQGPVASSSARLMTVRGSAPILPAVSSGDSSNRTHRPVLMSSGTSTQTSLVAQAVGSGARTIPLSALKNFKIVSADGLQHQRMILPSSTGATNQTRPQAQNRVTGHNSTQPQAISIAANVAQNIKLPLTVLNNERSAQQRVVSRLNTNEAQQQQQLNSNLVEAMNSSNNSINASNATTSLQAPGVRPRKPCNCTKSQCLKLYCECFANGEFCNGCNCHNCFNNLQHEEERQKAIKQCLERNPDAFKPKIGRVASDGERRHNKGCHCKRSGCMKNYCECYEAKIACTDACRCIGCHNVDEETGRKRQFVAEKQAIAENSILWRNSIQDLKPNNSPSKKSSLNTSSSSILSLSSSSSSRPEAKRRRSLLPVFDQIGSSSSTINTSTTSGATASAQLSRKVSNDTSTLVKTPPPFGFLTTEVVEAACQCLLAQAEEAERLKSSEIQAEAAIIDEFSRCLVQIIDMANKSQGRQYGMSKQETNNEQHQVAADDRTDGDTNALLI